MGIKQTKTTLATALNFKLGEDGSLPEWVELVPANKAEGRDGRWWYNDNPQAIINATLAEGVDLPIDIEHATEKQAPRGKPAPAQGWIKAASENFEVRDGRIFGKVDWNDSGIALIKGKQYRYYSPVFIFDRKSKRIIAITSLGLTNNPNLSLTALNQKEDSTMELAQAIATALGLGKDATVDDAVEAIKKLKSDKDKAENQAQTPPLADFVPRADYDKAVNRATTAETNLAEKETAEQNNAIDTAVNAALKAGKITPATKDYYRAMCQKDGGLDEFNKFVDAAPVVVGKSDLDGKQPENSSKALNSAEQDAAKALGWSDAEFQEAKKNEEKG